jgi:hypothetical protein
MTHQDVPQRPTTPAVAPEATPAGIVAPRPRAPRTMAISRRFRRAFEREYRALTGRRLSGRQWVRLRKEQARAR